MSDRIQRKRNRSFGRKHLLFKTVFFLFNNSSCSVASLYFNLNCSCQNVYDSAWKWGCHVFCECVFFLHFPRIQYIFDLHCMFFFIHQRRKKAILLLWKWNVESELIKKKEWFKRWMHALRPLRHTNTHCKMPRCAQSSAWKWVKHAHLADSSNSMSAAHVGASILYLKFVMDCTRG